MNRETEGETLIGHFLFVHSDRPKRTITGQSKWKVKRRARTFYFPPKLSIYPRFGRPDLES